ncbi:uncharacterized protein F4812DRAFT_151215 [Daldinia caldariorum]|uniref:uncharacterized protein n=1 Tax=Daldinia caldariorum TaxID=326644 RepID=UPI0020084BCB|nr:uncharacterized protein F4812DRAFT_151215 [Daldinia caldariorum]KAI1464701.1 hypothetical protein F4812DRAFT_151215 [Daldinia caldariorum]
MYSTMEVAPSTAPEFSSADSSAPEVAPETYHHPQYYQCKDYYTASQQSPPQLNSPPSPPGQAEIAGLKKPTFWLLVALFSAVALALGLGTGLGLGLRNNGVVDNKGASADNEAITNGATSSSPTRSESTTSTSTGTSTTGTTKSSSSNTPVVAVPTPTVFVDSGCPDRSGGAISGKNRSYDVYCDSDLTGTDQASLVVNSLEECLALCDSLNWTQKRGDVGCVWNEKGVVGQKKGTCWCKGGDSIKVTSLAGIVVASPAP